MEKKLAKLFEPISIGSMEIPNRIAFAPFSNSYTDDFGYVTDRLVGFYEARAKGGAGLIIVENTCISPSGRTRFTTLQIFNDEAIPGHKKLVKAIHKHGKKIALQLAYAGRLASPRATLTYTFSASGIATTTFYESEFAEYRKMSREEIQRITSLFVVAAKRAVEAGYDAIELHGAHGLLISEFLSPLQNTRTDEYGGTFENRMRFAKEIVKNIKKELGKDFPIIFRFSGDEGYAPDGITIDLAPKIGKVLEECGVDGLHISAGLAITKPRPDLYESPPPLRPTSTLTPPSVCPEGCFTHLAEAVKKEVRVPVITVGRILTPIFANKILEEGKADIVAIGRGLVADPEWPNKALRGEFDDIIPCIGCMACNKEFFNRRPVRCIANPLTGYEYLIKIKPTNRPKKVLIVGGGPGGVVTAIMSKKRGHNPILFEKEGELGGQLRLGAASPLKREFRKLIEYYKYQLKKLRIEVHLNTKVDLKMVEEEKPDVVVCATGIKPVLPEIPGIKLGNVSTIYDVLAEKVKDLGDRIVIIGGYSGDCETALFLQEKGYAVTLVYKGDMKKFGSYMEQNMRRFAIDMMRASRIPILFNMECVEVAKDGIKLRDRKTGKEEFINADNVVLSTKVSPNVQLAKELKKLPLEMYIIGDALSPRRAVDAVHEAMRIAVEYLP